MDTNFKLLEKKLALQDKLTDLQARRIEGNIKPSIFKDKVSKLRSQILEVNKEMAKEKY